MGNIPQFSAQQTRAATVQGASSIPETTRSVGGGISEGLGSLGAAVGATAKVFKKREEEADIANIHNLKSKAITDLTALQTEAETTAVLGAPGHTEAMAKATQDYYDKLEGSATTSAGRLLLSQHKASLTSVFATNAISFQSKSRGVKASTDYKKTINDDKNTLLQNPEMLDLLVEGQLTKIDDPTGMYANTLDAAALADMRVTSVQELTEFAVRGTIQKNPYLALDMLEAGDFSDDLDAETVDNLISATNQEINAIRADDVLTAKREKLALKARHDVVKDDMLLRMLPDAEKPLTVKEILHSDLDPSDKVAYSKLLDAELSEGIKTDDDVFLTTFARINLPDGDPLKITDADDLVSLVGKGLTMENFKTLRSEITNADKPAVKVEKTLKDGIITIATNTLSRTNPLTGIRDPKGDAIVQGWLSNFLTEYPARIAEGDTPQELLTPGNKKYMGNDIVGLKRSLTQIMQDVISDLGGVVSVEGVGGGSSVDLSRASSTASRDGVKIYFVDGIWYNGKGARVQ